ncbi:DUF2802 domain-containing protein [Teredinibacter purpureus]|uniref:DUF2802 domain-containing protein n=1 Tax=Teredinibacter purpureus TaxID=2731756 RepID=UPI000699087B|nr:DUF2802 domain-containing protein [Teredinibacter purpureus]
MEMNSFKLAQWFGALSDDLLVGFMGVVALCFVAIVVFSLLNRRRLLALRQQVDRLEKQGALINAGSRGLGQHIIALEKKLNTLQLEQEDIRHNDSEFSYSQAQKLVEQGIDVQTISANSGLSPSEIDLMKMLHAQSQLHDHVA